MKTFSFALAFALLTASNSFAQKEKNKSNDAFQKMSKSNKEIQKEERNLTEEQKQEREKQIEKDLENCFVICENGILVNYDGKVKVNHEGKCSGMSVYASNAKHHKQNKKVAETCGK